MKYIILDGELHTTEKECCSIFHRICKKCGGFVHRQPAFGCIMEVCEGCDGDWEVGPIPEKWAHLLRSLL